MSTRGGRLVRVGIVVSVTLASFGCGSDSDAAGEAACQQAGELGQDVAAGILTTAEARDRLRDVNDRAENSDTPGVAESAQAMLAAITAGNELDLRSAAEKMVAACAGQYPYYTSCDEPLGPVAATDPGYRADLDIDGDGVACEGAGR